MSDIGRWRTRGQREEDFGIRWEYEEAGVAGLCVLGAVHGLPDRRCRALVYDRDGNTEQPIGDYPSPDEAKHAVEAWLSEQHPGARAG